MCNGWKGRTQPREEAHVIMTKCLREREGSSGLLSFLAKASATVLPEGE